MVLVRAMREVQTGNVHARADHLLEHFRALRGRSDGANDARKTDERHLRIDVQIAQMFEVCAGLGLSGGGSHLRMERANTNK